MMWFSPSWSNTLKFEEFNSFFINCKINSGHESILVIGHELIQQRHKWLVSNWEILNGGIFSFVHIAGKIRRSRAFCIAYYVNKASPQLKGFSITNWSTCSVVVKGINRQHSCRNVLIPRLAISCFALKSELFEPRKNWNKKACGDSDTLRNWSSRKKQRERPPPNLTKNIFLPATANHSFDFLSIF